MKYEEDKLYVISTFILYSHLDDINMFNQQTIEPEQQNECPVKMIKVNNVELVLNKMLELFTEKSFDSLMFEARSLISTILNTDLVEILIIPDCVDKNK